MKKQLLILSVFLIQVPLVALQSMVPVGIAYDWSTVQRKGMRGDNWCMTWAADGNLYTMMDDGSGFSGDEKEWNSQLLRISGGPDFSAEDVWECSGWPFHPASRKGNGLYGYGTYAVEKRIYTWVWKSEGKGYHRPIGNRLIYTDDFGKTFYQWDGTLMTEETFGKTDPSSFFFYKEQPVEREGREAYAFNWIAFCQNGQANGSARDEYVYMYTVEQFDVTRLGMIRVHKDLLCDKGAYEYLESVDSEGRATWTVNPAKRGVTHVFPEKNYNGLDWLWCSWQPSVIYNPGLDCYLMVSYGISDSEASYWSGWCRATSESSGTVIMLYSRKPWGPWKEFYRKDEWKAPGEVPSEWGFDATASRAYQFKFNPKWIEDGGRILYLHWSDAGGRWDEGFYGHSSWWYRWNQVRIHLDVN